MSSKLLWRGAALCLSCTFGCGEDVGTCDTTKSGRDAVLVGKTTVVYAGQAIMNRACGTGCHASTATGDARRGAPAGLDFDLLPIMEDDAAGTRTNLKGDTVIKLKSEQLSALRHRQQKVLGERGEIWRQVQENLMPPDNSFEAAITNIFTAKDSTPCTQGDNFNKLPSGFERQVFRNWLACGAPIVEANGDSVSKPQAAGTVGWQFLSCSSASASTGPVSLETLLGGPLSTCSACHPIISPPSFSTIDAITTSVLQSKDAACNDKPYVTPGDPDQSFLYDVLALKDPGCGHTRMPQGGPYLSASELMQVSEWIKAGAPATDADLPGSGSDSSDSSSSSGSDDSSSDSSSDGSSSGP